MVLEEEVNEVTSRMSECGEWGPRVQPCSIYPRDHPCTYVMAMIASSLSFLLHPLSPFHIIIPTILLSLRFGITIPSSKYKVNELREDPIGGRSLDEN